MEAAIVVGLRGKPINPNDGSAKFEFARHGLVRLPNKKKRASAKMYQERYNDGDQFFHEVPVEDDSNGSETLEARFFRRHKLRRLSSGSIEAPFHSGNEEMSPPRFIPIHQTQESNLSPLRSFGQILAAACEIDCQVPKIRTRTVSPNEFEDITYYPSVDVMTSPNKSDTSSLSPRRFRLDEMSGSSSPLA